MSSRGIPRLRAEHLRIFWRNRGLVPRLLLDYARVLSGRPVVRGIELAVTYRCNAHCPHCCIGTLADESRPELSAGEIERVVGELVRLGVLNVNLTGGEPCLREDLAEIVERLGRRNVFLTMGTNGWLFDGARAADLARRGLRGISISVDAPTAEEHDRFRDRAGAFEAAFTAAENARRAGLLVFFCTIATRANAASGGLAAIADLVLGRGFTLTVNYPVLSGRWSEAQAVVLTPGDCEALDEILSRPGVRWEGSSNFFRQGCPAGGEKIYLTPYGDVMPCAGIHAIYGSVREEPLADIVARMRATPVFRCHYGRCLAGASRPFLDGALREINAAVSRGPAAMRRSAERLLALDPPAPGRDGD